MNSYPVIDGKAYLEPIGDVQPIIDNAFECLGGKFSNFDSVCPVQPGDSIYVQCKTCKGERWLQDMNGDLVGCTECIDGCQYFTVQFAQGGEARVKLVRKIRSLEYLSETSDGWIIVAEVE